RAPGPCSERPPGAAIGTASVGHFGVNRGTAISPPASSLRDTVVPQLKAKEKRGWTLNSAGYLLGPHAVDNHRSFNDKHGFTGKREIQPDEDIKAGNLGRPLADENIVRTVIEFLTYLHLKEAGALENLPSPEETNLS
uniref:Galanin peptides n=1 Tax=Gallus gallus TaxID=9031 RepID=A0A8V1A4G3_CHICK